MNHLLRFTLTALLLVLSATAFAEDPEFGPSGAEAVTRWRIGMEITATGDMTGVFATTPVPMDWPEQTVKLLSEDVSPLVKKVSYRTLDGGVKQMLVSIPRLAAGESAHAFMTYEVRKKVFAEPKTTGDFIKPKPGKDTTKYLGVSPYIETNDARIKKLAPLMIDGKNNDWDRALSIFDYVRDNVKYEFSETIKPATAALDDRKGDCEELTSLFIAFARANKIPARAVWVPGHCYPEFCLQDAEGKAHWFPCQVAGAGHDFGRMREDRPILQKGDLFKVPEEKGPQRYVKQFLRAANAESNPTVKFVLENLDPKKIPKSETDPPAEESK